jgi:glutaredoxin
MKKSIFTLLLLIVFITTTACGNVTVKESEPKGEGPKQVEEEPGNEETSDSETEENEEANNDDQTEDVASELIMKKAEEILQLLKEKNEEELATYVHPKKGVLFSPYIFVDEKAITFNKEKVKEFFEDSEIYTWGTQDGSGEPIVLTPSDYYATFIYDSNFEQADETVFDRVETRGNTIRNITEVFPDSHSVEYFVKGTEEYGNMDWKALNLVFEQDEQGEWKLVAIVHDQWTI